MALTSLGRCEIYGFPFDRRSRTAHVADTTQPKRKDITMTGGDTTLLSGTRHYLDFAAEQLRRYEEDIKRAQEAVQRSREQRAARLELQRNCKHTSSHLVWDGSVESDDRVLEGAEYMVCDDCDKRLGDLL